MRASPLAFAPFGAWSRETVQEGVSETSCKWLFRAPMKKERVR